MEHYRHSNGTLYLPRYMKGGAFRYRDHADQRTKQRRLSPMALIRQLLRHVPLCGVRTVRQYCLYASACRVKRSRCRRQLGDLCHTETGAGSGGDELFVELRLKLSHLYQIFAACVDPSIFKQLFDGKQLNLG